MGSYQVVGSWDSGDRKVSRDSLKQKSGGVSWGRDGSYYCVYSKESQSGPHSRHLTTPLDP